MHGLACCLALAVLCLAASAKADTLSAAERAFARQDYARAAPVLLVAAERGLPVAQTYIGYMYQNGFGVPRLHRRGKLGERPPPQGGGFGLRLKAGLGRPKGQLANWLDDFEVVVGNLGLLILNIFLPHLVRHIAARGHPIAPTPEMLTPIPFAKRLIFRQQFVRALAFETAPPETPTDAAVSRSAYAHDRDCRSSVDGHLVRPRDFPQQLPRPLPYIST